MAVIRKVMFAIRKYIFIVLSILLIFKGIASAKTKVLLLNNFLSQSGYGGKQVYDGSGSQRISLFEPMLFIESQINESTKININAVFDTLTSASARAFDTGTGASVKTEADTGTGASAKTEVDTGTGASVKTGADTGTGASVKTGTGDDDGDDKDDKDDNDDDDDEDDDGDDDKDDKGDKGNDDDDDDDDRERSAPKTQEVANLDEKNDDRGDEVRETRKSVNISVTHREGTWIFTPSVGFSTEADYKSVSSSLGVQKSFNEDNFTTALGYHYFDDKGHVYDIISRKWLGWKPKKTQSLDVSASQILSKRDIILIGCGVTQQTGYLAGNRNTVNAVGTRTLEVLPDNRNKFVSTLRYVHGFNDILALHADYRFYQDDWGINAHTLEPSLAISLQDDAGFLQLIYRYYQQQETKYYDDSFTALQKYMTSDSDLARFHANEGGIRYSYTWDTQSVFESINAGGSVFYYKRSNDLQAVMLQISIGGNF